MIHILVQGTWVYGILVCMVFQKSWKVFWFYYVKGFRLFLKNMYPFKVTLLLSSIS